MKNKNVLVTGADGFIGSHLTEILCKSGFNVRALTLYNSFGSHGWLDNSTHSKNIDFRSGDIRDNKICDEITKDIHYVFNLAALIAIPYSYFSPKSYIQTNIMGTANMCESSLKNKVQKFIQISTSEVYGTAKYVPIDEQHPLQPQSPYSASKIGSDSIAISYARSFNLPLILARPFNTYGPRQSNRAVIPTIISQLLSSKKDINLGSLSPTRDFNYVEDTCNALIALSNTEDALYQTVNIGSGKEISINDTFLLISKLMNKKNKIAIDSSRKRPKKSEVERLLCDNTKLRELTNFKSKYSLEKGLSKTIKWFSKKENLSKYKPDEYSI